MSVRTIIMTLMIVAAAGATLTGCYKNTVVMNNGENEVTRAVSFAADIVPIFNKSCNVSGCHSTGGIAPNLTAANAYNALAGGNYFNTGDPKSSELYQWMTGQRGTPMPLSGANKEYTALVLAWIKQGALNN